MQVPLWLRSLAARLKPARQRQRRPRPSFRPHVEGLEDRVTPSTGGLLDPTFGSGGTVLSSFANIQSSASAVTVQPDGKIVIAGYTIVPLELYWKNGRAKLQIGLAKGKKQHDKRATEKERDWERQKARLLRQR